MRNRPILVKTENGVQPAVSEKPVLATLPNMWRGFGVEDLSLPAGELPPNSTLLSHVICKVSCPTPVTLNWRENGEKYQSVRQDDLLFRSQQELIDFRWDKPMDVQVLGIEIDTLRSIAVDVPGASKCELLPRFGIQDRFLRGLMLALHEDMAANCPTGPLLGESICIGISAYALQHYSVKEIRFKDYQRGLSRECLKLALEYIDANLGEDLSIRALAHRAGMGVHYFRKLFSISTGVTVHEYVLRARIDRARQLVRCSHLSIAEVALRVGFSSQSHLTAEFRRRVGVTPAAYRATFAPLALAARS